MARIARVVLPGVVHHITQRGVRSMDIFIHDKDRMEYLSLLSRQAERVGLQFVAYCLMSNHIHLLVIPSNENSLRLGIGEAHRLYTRYINFRDKTRGHLFQERFFSCPLDDNHFISAARYVERNPVRAKICKKAESMTTGSPNPHKVSGMVIPAVFLTKYFSRFSFTDGPRILLLILHPKESYIY